MFRLVCSVAVFGLSVLAEPAFAGDFYLVSRDSCPGCVVMKGRIPRSVKVLDYDRDPLAKAIHRGNLIPQLVYIPSDNGNASRLTGVYSREAVAAWIESLDPGASKR